MRNKNLICWREKDFRTFENNFKNKIKIKIKKVTVPSNIKFINKITKLRRIISTNENLIYYYITYVMLPVISLPASGQIFGIRKHPPFGDEK